MCVQTRFRLGSHVLCEAITQHDFCQAIEFKNGCMDLRNTIYHTVSYIYIFS